MKEGDSFIDLFCGSCNVVSGIRQDVTRYANDLNMYLISMWTSLQKGWMPPKRVCEEEYKLWKNLIPTTSTEKATKCFIGFGCSFAGKWWGGYARSATQDYALCAHNSTMKKANNMKDVIFTSLSYQDVFIPQGAIVYCDIPYKNTTQYKAVGDFDHEVFYDWLKKQTNCKVFISEYEHNVPEWGEIVWRKDSNQYVRNKNGEQAKTVEVLWKVKET